MGIVFGVGAVLCCKAGVAARLRNGSAAANAGHLCHHSHRLGIWVSSGTRKGSKGSVAANFLCAFASLRRIVTQTVSLRGLNGIQRARKLTACVTRTKLGHHQNENLLPLAVSTFKIA